MFVNENPLLGTEGRRALLVVTYASVSFFCRYKHSSDSVKQVVSFTSLSILEIDRPLSKV
jgi:hypothetical protein